MAGLFFADTQTLFTWMEGWVPVTFELMMFMLLPEKLQMMSNWHELILFLVWLRYECLSSVMFIWLSGQAAWWLYIYLAWKNIEMQDILLIFCNQKSSIPAMFMRTIGIFHFTPLSVALIQGKVKPFGCIFLHISQLIRMKFRWCWS